MAAYAEPAFLPDLRRLVRADGQGGFRVEPIEWDAFAKRPRPGAPYANEHAQLAAFVQTRLEETLPELARWLHGRTGSRFLTMAGGVALNCVANSRLADEGPYERVRPAAGDASTALGGALVAAGELGDDVSP